jgi:hypothetical protein
MFPSESIFGQTSSVHITVKGINYPFTSDYVNMKLNELVHNIDGKQAGNLLMVLSSKPNITKKGMFLLRKYSDAPKAVVITMYNNDVITHYKFTEIGGNYFSSNNINIGTLSHMLEKFKKELINLDIPGSTLGMIILPPKK